MKPFGPESEGIAYLQGQILALSAISGHPNVKQNPKGAIEKIKSPYEEKSPYDDCFKQGFADTINFVSKL